MRTKLQRRKFGALRAVNRERQSKTESRWSGSKKAQMTNVTGGGGVTEGSKWPTREQAIS